MTCRRFARLRKGERGLGGLGGFSSSNGVGVRREQGRFEKLLWLDLSLHLTVKNRSHPSIHLGFGVCLCIAMAVA